MARAASIRADTADLRAVLAKHSEFAQKTVPDMVRAHARLCAVELALRTTPFSVGSMNEKAKELGEKAVEWNIKRMIMDRKDFESFIGNFGNERLRARIQKLIAAGKWATLTEVLNRIGYAEKLGGVDFVKRSGFAALHEKYRHKITGRTLKKTDKMHVATSSISGYVKKVQKRVGMSKGGWAQCARLVGNLKAGKNGKAADNARGIPQWVKRHKHGGEVKDKTNNTKNPHVIMTNTFPWISRICPKVEQDKSVRIATQKMLESFVHALKAAAKKNAKDNKAKSEPKSA
jgi:hypothetical protein